MLSNPQFLLQLSGTRPTAKLGTYLASYSEQLGNPAGSRSAVAAELKLARLRLPLPTHSKRQVMTIAAKTRRGAGGGGAIGNHGYPPLRGPQRYYGWVGSMTCSDHRHDYSMNFRSCGFCGKLVDQFVWSAIERVAGLDRSWSGVSRATNVDVEPAPVGRGLQTMTS